MTSLKEVGEFGLIERLQHLCETAYPHPQETDLVLGIGDDAAIWRPRQGYELVLTCDAQVAGRHFLAGLLESEAWSTWLGRRCATVNISDIAAMGAQPRLALISLGLPFDLPVEQIEALYRGMAEAFAQAGAQIAGGNITLTEGPLFVDITLMGETIQGRSIRREGAKEGDLIGLFGSLGASAAGLQMLQARDALDWKELSLEDLHPLEQAYLCPKAFLKEAQSLVGYAHAMIDISDGLLADIGHLLRASKVGARLYETKLPCSEELKRWSIAKGYALLDTLFASSDDYSLLFCVSPQDKDALDAQWKQQGCHVAWIGEIHDLQGGFLLERTDTSTQALQQRGWQHF